MKENVQFNPEMPFSAELINKNIVGNSVDELVLQGIDNIRKTGVRIDSSSGPAFQSYGVNYLLLNSRNRLHSLRAPTSTQYLCRELLAYFKGSLRVDDGLGQASAFWRTLQDQKGEINSNYGYYVFHQPLLEKEAGEKNQYQWVLQSILSNKDSRKAVININQPNHKKETKDFPCTLGMQYFIRRTSEGRSYLCSDVSSRSTDIITGLPYDMGFFSFMTELVWKDLLEKGVSNLELGYTIMKASFTQIYDKTARLADMILLNRNRQPGQVQMPQITNAAGVLTDIYNQTAKTEVMQWVYKNADIIPK